MMIFDMIFIFFFFFPILISEWMKVEMLQNTIKLRVRMIKESMTKKEKKKQNC